jgi:hypothetical protein
VGPACRCLLFAFLGIAPLFSRLAWSVASAAFILQAFQLLDWLQCSKWRHEAARGDRRQCARVRHFSLNLSISSIDLFDLWCLCMYSESCFIFCLWFGWLLLSPFVATRLGYDVVHWIARSGTCCVFIARIHCCYSILFLNPSLSVLSILTISICPSICMCWSMWS